MDLFGNGLENYDEKSLTIVHSENTGRFANLLRDLISTGNKANEDEGKIQIDTAIWDEKQYNDNKAQIADSNFILFIGWSGDISKEIYGITPKFHKYGMEYGWLGTYGYMNVSEERLSKKEKAQFEDFISDYTPDIDLKKINNFVAQLKAITRKGIGETLKTVAVDGVIADPVLFSIFNAIKGRKELFREIQYLVLAHVFYKDGLRNFLEENS